MKDDVSALSQFNETFWDFTKDGPPADVLLRPPCPPVPLSLHPPPPASHLPPPAALRHRQVAEDLLGADVSFHHSKLNFKWGGGGQEIKWHQDIQFWPHTNYSPLTIGCYLEDVDDAMGPMCIRIPKPTTPESHVHTSNTTRPSAPISTEPARHPLPGVWCLCRCMTASSRCKTRLAGGPGCELTSCSHNTWGDLHLA